MLTAYIWRDTTNHNQWIAIRSTETIQPQQSGQNKNLIIANVSLVQEFNAVKHRIFNN